MTPPERKTEALREAMRTPLSSRPLVRFAAIAVTMAILGLLWWFVLPPQMGGRTVILTTKGTSMEPFVHSGDVAVLRKAPKYRVGDVIAYHSDTLNATVMHRIIDVKGKEITTQGDNNSWVDLDHPTESQIKGRLDHLIPNGGRVLEALQSKPARMLGAGLLGLCVYWSLRGRNERLRAATSRNALRIRSNLGLIERLPFSRSWLVSIMATCLAISAGVTALAFSKPVTGQDAREAIYNQYGAFGYSASTKPGGELVYPDGQVSTGDTIYGSLVDELFVAYTYRFEGLSKFKGTGSLTMSAVLSGKSGWTHKIPLGDVTSFEGGSARASAVIDLAKMHELAQQIQQTTKVRDGNYTVSIQGITRLNGTVAGQRFTKTFTGKLDLVGDGTTLKPQEEKAKSPNAQSSSSSGMIAKKELGGSIVSSEGGSILLPAGGPTQLKLIGLTLGILTLRVAGIALSLLFGAGLAFAIWRRRTETADNDEPVEVRQHKDLLVPVTGSIGTWTSSTVVNLNSLHDLARIAEQYEVLILQENTPLGMVFVVNHGGTTYRYQRASTPRERFGVDQTISVNEPSGRI